MFYEGRIRLFHKGRVRIRVFFSRRSDLDPGGLYHDVYLIPHAYSLTRKLEQQLVEAKEELQVRFGINIIECFLRSRTGYVIFPKDPVPPNIKKHRSK